MTRYIASLFPYGGEKAECTISGKASPFQKFKSRCFVSSSSHHCPSNCLAFWRPQTIGRWRSPIVYIPTNTLLEPKRPNLLLWCVFALCNVFVMVLFSEKHNRQLISVSIHTWAPFPLSGTVRLGTMWYTVICVSTVKRVPKSAWCHTYLVSLSLGYQAVAKSPKRVKLHTLQFIENRQKGVLRCCRRTVNILLK